MFARLLLCTTILLGFTSWQSVAAQEGTPDSGTAPTLYEQVRSGQLDTSTLLIGIEPGTSPDEIRQIIDDQGWQIGRLWLDLGIVEAHIPSDLVRAASADEVFVADAQRASLEQHPAIRYAVFDGVVRAAQTPEPPMLEPTPNDTFYGDQWAFPKLNVVKSWNIAHGDPGVTVAVIDSGYSAQHEDITIENLWVNQAELNGQPNADDDSNGYTDDIYGWDWVEDDNQPNDQFGHGTHVLGVIAGATNNQLGIASIGRGIQAAPLRILNNSGTGEISDLIAAMEYARAMDMKIINLSLVIPFKSQAIEDAVIAANAADQIVVAAVGNTGSTVQWPAKYAETVAVAATDQTDTRTSFSSSGPEVDLAAPGVGILSAHLNNSYRQLDGTSMATPHVAALAGLIWSLRPDLTSAGVLDLMANTAFDANAQVWPGRDNFLGNGRIDAYAALLEASAGVDLRPDEPAPVAELGQPLQLGMQVTAGPNALPVTGAIVSYQIFSDTQSAAISPVERKVSNDQGRIVIDTSAPATPGDYIVRARQGQNVLELPLLVISGGPISVTLEVTPTIMQAGTDGVHVKVHVENEEGTADTLQLPLRLETDLGTFGNSQPVLEATVSNGVYATQFIPGSTSGTTTIRASINNAYSDMEEVRILPGPATQLDASTTHIPTSGGSNETQQFQLNFIVTDEFGNPVADGTSIQVYTSAGVLAADTLSTVNGAANVVVTIPSNETDPVIVWVTVPGTMLEKRLEISLFTVRAYLPLVH